MKHNMKMYQSYDVTTVPIASDVVLDKIIRQLVRENRMQPKPDQFEHCQKKIRQRRRLTRDH